MNNYAWNTRNRPNTVNINGRRGFNNIQSRIITNNNKTRAVTTKPVINNSNLVIEEEGVRWYSSNKPLTINKPAVYIGTKSRVVNSNNNTRAIINNNSKPVFNSNSRPVLNSNSRPINRSTSRGVKNNRRN
tara:strand:- start:796 stop:1188 length:393 start_codon:yes stop_codon:yes gene_type:complete